MNLKYSLDQRLKYLEMIDRVSMKWLAVFDCETDFYSAAYWDLFTRIWREGGPVRKTDALKFMTAVKSAHTAGKYVDVALSKGLLIERDNPEDARSKLLVLSDDMRARLDAFFDQACDEVIGTEGEIASLAPEGPKAAVG